MTRLLTLKAADAMDRYGNKVAKDLIAQVANRHGYEIGNVIQSPIEGLIQYHSQL